MKPLWKPDQKKLKKTHMVRFLKIIQEKHHLKKDNYQSLHQWSVKNPALFWEEVWKYCEIKASSPYKQVMGELKMPGTKWFSESRLNFAENLLRYRDDKTALIYQGEDGAPSKLTYKELYVQVAKGAHALKNEGLKKGDRVASFLPNCIETVIAMLATTSLGAIWSSCSPDFGLQGILDRFSQIEHKILFAPNGYSYNGKFFDVTEKVKAVQKSLPSLKRVVILDPSLSAQDDRWVSWDQFLDNEAQEIEFEQLPFDHPIYILYSSGTTGVPKCIVHGAGGTLIQHLKELTLHTDLNREDTIFYYTTCGWMMWNWQVSSLARGTTLFLYDGNAVYPKANRLWELAEKFGITILGASPKYFSACQKEGVIPIKENNLSKLRAILSTGSPLSIEEFQWIYSSVKKDVLVASISGGTDLISCFMLGNPMLPVYAGEIQCLGLGMDVHVFNEQGKEVLGKKGELVCATPFPSMPLYFWNDPENKKYHQTYFETYPNVWRHGDYIEITKNGGVIVYGRSDATLKPSGVRIGTAEIYRVVEAHPAITDSIVVGHRSDNDIEIVLFVVLKNNMILTDELKKDLQNKIKIEASPRHKPKYVFQVQDIPRTLSGKKVEVAVTQMIHHEEVGNLDALKNPEALEQFKNFF